MTSPEEPALDAAASWLARLRAADLTVFERNAFRRWLRASPDHLHAFEDMLALWDQLGALRFAPVGTPARVIPGRHASRKGDQP